MQLDFIQAAFLLLIMDNLREKVQAYQPLDFYAKQIVEGFITGMHKSPFHGFSVEFAEHRLYNFGESTKHIDWKLYGKTDRLYVKKYEEETNLRCQIILDVSSSMYFPSGKSVSIENPNKLAFSIYASAALMLLLKKQRDAVGLSLFSSEIEEVTEARTSNTHHQHLLSILDKYFQPHPKNETKKTAIADVLHLLAEKVHKRSLVIIFSDMLDDQANIDKIFSALQHLKHNKHEVVIFHVHDKEKELDFDFNQRPYKFIDMETGEKIKIMPDEIREEYAKTIQQYKKEIKLKCAQYKIEFVEADINQGFEQILLPFLIKRSKLY